MAAGVDAACALSQATVLGPFFTWEPAGETAGWRPWSDLADSEVIAERVAGARTALARMSGLSDSALPERVVASVTFLGYAARVLSPLLGAAVVGGVLPIVDLWWRPGPAGPLLLGYTGARALDCAYLDDDALAVALIEVAVEGFLAPVIEVCRARFALSPQVLWGNVASALAGAAGMIADKTPDHGERAGRVTARMLGLGPLAGTGELVRPDPTSARRFLVRRNCCLYYRIPGGGTCGDCVLTPEPDRRRHWQSALRR